MSRASRSMAALSGLVLAGGLATTGVLAASPEPTAAFPQIGPGEDWIAYQSQAGRRYGINLVRPDGTDSFFPLVDAPEGRQHHPDWSPDGDRLVFDIDDVHGISQIWITTVNDWASELLVPCVDPCFYAAEPAWSPDGSAIAYERHVMEDGQEVSTLEILDLVTGETRIVLTTGPDRGLYAPRWSPDGTHLVYEVVAIVGDELVGVALETLDLGAGTPEPVTLVPSDRFANNSDWSPDGSLISFSAPVDGADFEGPSDIWVIHPDGTGLRKVTNMGDSGARAFQATFTPDGSALIYTRTDAPNGYDDAMAIVGVDGTDLGPATTAGPVYGWHARVRR